MKPLDLPGVLLTLQAPDASDHAAFFMLPGRDASGAGGCTERQHPPRETFLAPVASERHGLPVSNPGHRFRLAVARLA